MSLELFLTPRNTYKYDYTYSLKEQGKGLWGSIWFILFYYLLMLVCKNCCSS